MTITPINIKTGVNAQHRVSFAQLGQVGVFCNGHMPNQIYDLRRGAAYDLGLPPSASAPTKSNGAGVLVGEYRWTIVWVDSNTGAISLPSGELSATMASQKATITAPASPPARATHFIVLRTKESGSVFYPVNRTVAAPYGTAIGNTYEDNNEDDLIGENEIILEDQEYPDPFRVCFAAHRRIWFVGGIIHRGTFTLTNLSANISSSDGGLTADMVGWRLSVPTDTGAKEYFIQSVTPPNSAVLTEVYAGTSGTKEIAIASPKRDRFAYSEPDEPEHFGESELSGPSNEDACGDDGEDLVGGINAGEEGVILAKKNSLWLLRFTSNPDPFIGDGKLFRFPVDRGIVNDLAIHYAEGINYGIDLRGIWRRAPGSLPDEIGGPLANDWKELDLNWGGSGNWHIGYHPCRRQMFFFISHGTDTYPKMAYIWSLSTQRWIGTARFPLGITKCITLPDENGMWRMVFFTEAKGAAGSYSWFWGIGKSFGVNPSGSPLLAGTITGGSSTTAQCTGAGWPTSGEALKGVPFTKIDADLGEETRIITGNTSSQVTLDSAWTTNPVNDVDRFWLGGIPARCRLPLITLGVTQRKKKYTEFWLMLKNKNACVPVELKCWLDGKATPAELSGKTETRDGVSKEEGSAILSADPTSFRLRYRLPINQDATQLQAELFSNEAGEPWDIQSIELDPDGVDIDTAKDPAK